MKVYEWTDAYFGSGHSGLFIETDHINMIIDRVKENGYDATGIEHMKSRHDDESE